MTLSTSTASLAPGESRTYNLAPGEAVTVNCNPNVICTVTETPDVIATADQAGQTNNRVSNLRYRGTYTYGPYMLGGTVLVQVSARSTSSVSVTLGSTAAAVVGAAGVSIGAYLERAGAVFNGTSDDGEAIQAALDSFCADFPRATAVFPADAGSCLIGSGLVFDPAKNSLDFNGLRIIPSGAITALTLQSDEEPSPNSIHYVQRFHIDGDLTSGQRGLYVNNPDAVLFGGGPSRVGLYNFAISQCDVGYEIGNGAYGMHHMGWCIYENLTGLKCASGLVDSYELPVWYGGFLKNNVIGLDLGDGQITFIGVSLDYNRRQAVMTGGRFLLQGCHIESNLKRNTYSAGQVGYSISGDSSLIIQGGRMIFTEGTGTDLDHVFDIGTTQDYQGGVWMENVTLSNVNPASGYVAKGTGNLYMRGCVPAAATTLCKGVHQTYNSLNYGDFEGASFPIDLIAVTNGGTITSRTVSTNVTLTQSATAARSGTNGMLVTKNTAAGASATADFVILAPVRSNSSVHSAKLHYRAPGSSARQVTIQFGYFKKLDNVAGSQIIPVITDVAYNVNSTVTLPGSDTGWVEVKAAAPYRRPPKGFDFVGWRIRVHDLNAAEVLYIDDVEIHQW